MPTPSQVSADHVRSAFDLPPDRAVKYFQKKGYALSWSWQETQAAAHHKAFTVAKVMSLDVLADIRIAVQRAKTEGMPFEQFQKELEPILQRKGWWGKQAVTRPDGTTEMVQTGSPWRLKTIYRTNLSSSYAAGRYLQAKKHASARPFWQYLATKDVRTRPAHLGLDGTVLRHDDPFWDTNYPPNGFNCRCTVRTLSQRQLDREKLEVSLFPPTPFEADESFRGNPAEVWEPELTQYSRALQRQFKKAMKDAPPAPVRAVPKPAPPPDPLVFGDPEGRDEITKQLFNADVSVVRIPSQEEDIIRVEKDLFGRTLTDHEWIRLTGAPDGASIRIRYTSSGYRQTETVFAIIRHEEYYDPDFDYESKRSLYRDHNGNVEMHNDLLGLAKGRAPRGLGQRIFSTQVVQARALGVRHITVQAAGYKGHPKFAGYIVWPKLGYEGEIPDWASREMKRDRTLPARVRNMKRFTDLMSTKEGADWWEEYGSEVHLDFDLRKRSRSMNFLRRKQIKNGVKL